MHRSKVTSIVLAAIMALCAWAAGAQPFPSKPVRIVVPFPAGGSRDVLARALANELTLAPARGRREHRRCGLDHRHRSSASIPISPPSRGGRISPKSISRR